MSWKLTKALIVSCALGYASSVPATADTTLVPLGDSVFDLRIDPERYSPVSNMILLRDIPWIYDRFDVDPELEPSVVILQDQDAMLPEGGIAIWSPDRALPYDGEELPPELQPDGFRIARGQSVYLIYYIPNNSDTYYASCAYNPRERILDFCGMTVRYGPDPKLEIRVRLYRRSNVAIPNFSSVAEKVHEFVRCELDVTHHDDVDSEDAADCRPIDLLAG